MSCHQEHRGQSVSLSEVSDLRCSSCHQVRFESFSNGHPEFTNYPFDRRSSIAFDHYGHFKTHFQEATFKDKAPSGCNECHIPDVLGRSMLVKSFEETCAACHAKQIEGVGRASAKGIEVLGVPGIDLFSLADAEISIGTWPVDAEDEITSFLNFLLSTDPDFVTAKQQLEDIDFLDLEGADHEVLEAVQDYAWAIKRFYAELASTGIPALQARMQIAIGRDIDMAGMGKLSGVVSVDAVRSAVRAWFPNLQTEISLLEAGEEVPIWDGEEYLEEDENEELVEGEEWSAAGGWYRDEFSLRYRPSGHADLMISNWLNFTFNPTATLDTEATGAVFNMLSDPKAPGRCTKCHSVDAVAFGVEGSGGQAEFHAHKVNWHGDRPVENEKTFTKFSHKVHLNLLDQEGCLSCHAINNGADFNAGYKDHNPVSYVSNFLSIKRETCAECHIADEAGAKCTSCHDYHIGIFPPAMNSAPEVMKSRL